MLFFFVLVFCFVLRGDFSLFFFDVNVVVLLMILLLFLRIIVNNIRNLNLENLRLVNASRLHLLPLESI